VPQEHLQSKGHSKSTVSVWNAIKNKLNFQYDNKSLENLRVDMNLHSYHRRDNHNGSKKIEKIDPTLLNGEYLSHCFDSPPSRRLHLMGIEIQ
jgi:hypothetical protein